jgi:hypothetical protein
MPQQNRHIGPATHLVSARPHDDRMKEVRDKRAKYRICPDPLIGSVGGLPWRRWRRHSGRLARWSFSKPGIYATRAGRAKMRPPRRASVARARQSNGEIQRNRRDPSCSICCSFKARSSASTRWAVRATSPIAEDQPGPCAQNSLRGDVESSPPSRRPRVQGSQDQVARRRHLCSRIPYYRLPASAT